MYRCLCVLVRGSVCVYGCGCVIISVLFVFVCMHVNFVFIHTRYLFRGIVFVCVHVCVSGCVFACIRLFVYVDVDMRACVRVHAFVFVYVCASGWCVCACACAACLLCSQTDQLTHSALLSTCGIFKHTWSMPEPGLNWEHTDTGLIQLHVCVCTFSFT